MSTCIRAGRVFANEKRRLTDSGELTVTSGISISPRLCASSPRRAQQQQQRRVLHFKRTMGATSERYNDSNDVGTDYDDDGDRTCESRKLRRKITRREVARGRGNCLINFCFFWHVDFRNFNPLKHENFDIFIKNGQAMCLKIDILL